MNMNMIKRNHFSHYLTTHTVTFSPFYLARFPSSRFSYFNQSICNPFFKPIPNEFIPSKFQSIIIYFTISEFNSSVFQDKISSKISLGCIYTVFIKVRYNYHNFFMAGNQFGFHYSSTENIDNLLQIVNIRLEEYFALYGSNDESILYVQLSFKRMDNKLLSEFQLKDQPSHITKEDKLITSKNLNIPVSISKDSLGNSLPVVVEKGSITNIELNINNKQFNFLETIRNKAKFLRSKHQDHITCFDKGFKFYLLKDMNGDFVLAVKVVTAVSIEKIRYSLDGVILNHVTDFLIGDSNYIERVSGDKVILLQNNKVISIKQNLKLKAIEKPQTKTLFIENKNIGVIDIETYKANENLHKIYALGFKTGLDENTITYYIDKHALDSNKIVLMMINEVLRSRYSNITFYCHNLGGYDIVFILKILYDFNDYINTLEITERPNPSNKEEQLEYDLKYNKYNISCILRDSKILKVTISRTLRDNKYSFSIVDSYCMLSDSLLRLGQNFEVATIKSKFPYKFSTESNLFYKGATPSINFYENDIKGEEYALLNIPHWSFYDETIKYLNNDLYSLYEILIKANKQLFRDYGVNISDNITISGLAVRIYLKDFYSNNIPDVNKSSLYRDLKLAYYGGITEVYKPFAYNLFYYDVNSLYPSLALQDMPGLQCRKILFYTDKQEIGTLFGFFYCSIEAPLNGYLGLLAVRRKSGLTFPLGKWEGLYFSC